MSVCLCHRNIPTFGGQKSSGQSGITNLACDDTVLVFFFSILMIFHVFQLFQVLLLLFFVYKNVTKKRPQIA